MSGVLGAIGGITDLIGGGQRRRAQESEQRHQILQMALANKMQKDQFRQQQSFQQNEPNQENTSTSKNMNYLIFGGITLIIIALIAIIVWKQKQQV